MSFEEKTGEIAEMLKDNVLKDVIVEETATEGIVDRFKNSEIGKAIFGEDGKFDREDVERLSESAKSAVKDAADKMKGLKLLACSGAQEVKQTANDTLEVYNMEQQIRQSRLRADAEYHNTVRQMKTDVKTETEKLEELMRDY